MHMRFAAAGIVGLATFAIGAASPARAAYIYDFTGSEGELKFSTPSIIPNNYSGTIAETPLVGSATFDDTVWNTEPPEYQFLSVTMGNGNAYYAVDYAFNSAGCRAPPATMTSA